MKGKKWTQREIKILKEYYPTTKVNDFRNKGLLDRSEKAITQKVHILSLKAIPKYHEPSRWTSLSYNPFDRLTCEERAYIAGIIDGEGCFHIRKNKIVDISVTNTNMPILLWLKNKIGGNVYNATPRKEPRNATAIWNLCGYRKGCALIQLIKPYLIIKKERAEQVLSNWQPI